MSLALARRRSNPKLLRVVGLRNLARSLDFRPKPNGKKGLAGILFTGRINRPNDT
jgi:hypothetical protein